MDKNIVPSKTQIEQAYQRISPYIKITPLLSSTYINSITQASLQFKCQNFQKTGSFKVRGAANKILQLKSPKVLCAFSSGNHAQAVAYVGHRLGLKSYIVMPSDTPQVKKNAVKQYQAEIVEAGPTSKQQQQTADRVTKQHNASFVHPFNDLQVIAGAASIGFQTYQGRQNYYDFMIVPVGGGGLISGTLLSTLYFSPKTTVIGVEPYLARDTFDSLRSGKMEAQYPPITLAEGVRTSIGNVTFSVMRENLKEVILVSEEEMISAARMFMERMKIVVEISGALVLAAIIKEKQRFKGKKVCAIISGGNMDLTPLFNSFRAKL